MQAAREAGGLGGILEFVNYDSGILRASIALSMKNSIAGEVTRPLCGARVEGGRESTAG